MKKLVTVLALGLYFTATSYAQTNPSQDKTAVPQNKHPRENRREPRGQDQHPQITLEQRASQHTERWSKQLNLSKHQEKKLLALNLKQAQQMQALHNQFATGSDKSQLHEQRQQIQADWERAFKHIVSKKQFAQYQTERKQMQANRSKHFGKGQNIGDRNRRSANG